MRIARFFLDFLLYSNIFIAICAAAITAETYLLVQTAINWIYVAFVFFSTIVFYDFPSLYFAGAAFSANQSERHRWIVGNRIFLQVLTAISIIALAVLVFFLSFTFILWMIPNAMLAFAYFFPQTHLRSIVGLKATIVAFVWMTTTAFYPLFLLSSNSVSEILTNPDFYSVLVERFLFMLPLCIIFNVRDVEADRKAGLRTIPVVYGLKVAIGLSLIFLFFNFNLVVLQRGFSAQGIALGASAILTGIIILRSTPERSDYFYSFWIDGMILLQAALLFCQL